MPETLLDRLLARGDRLSLEGGQLVIEAQSGVDVPDKWLSDNRELIVAEIAKRLAVNVLKYESYSTGYYEVKSGVRKSGLTMQFCNLRTGQQVFAIFNVELTRQRNTRYGKKGDRLPDKQFRAKPKSHFSSLWNRLGMKSLPTSERHQYMGLFSEKYYFMVASEEGKALHDSIEVASISFEQLRCISATSNAQVDSKYSASTAQVSHTSKSSQLAHVPYGPHDNIGAREESYVNKVISKSDKGDVQYSMDSHHKEQDRITGQSDKEWLEEYDRLYDESSS
ncbi:hypothetical protein [Halioxenophilus sp. WMMB6]|uniref:hypothetical protein n=1 Tax=Halioxenophilus sp. WMMB6 TaxID=3073815 RepID=UPI00295EB0BD|nr:hypothetical protein [Halioxenophilus sp. WMMB6]